MLMDFEAKFSNEQAITASAASADVIDWGAIGTPMHAAAALDVDWGIPDCLFLQGFVTTTFATLTSLTIAIQVDTVENFASPTAVLTTGAIPVASLVEGVWLRQLRMPRGLTQRYMRAYYTVTGSNATAGAITLGVVAGEQSAFVTGV